MMLEGILLEFGSTSMNKFIIPKECDITIPEYIPVVWNYNFGCPEYVIGNAEVEVLEDRIKVTVKSSNVLFNEIMKDRKRILCGGFWNSITSHFDENGVRIVEKANLKGIGVYEKGDENLYLEIKEDK